MKTVLFCALSIAALGTFAADERSQCSDPAVQDRQACLREAGAARAEARRGTLADANTDFDKNRLERCSWHKAAEERDYCERRMRGEGTTTGSVEGGGILRELTVIVPVEEAPVTPVSGLSR
jgi:hypothetical protein